MFNEFCRVKRTSSRTFGERTLSARRLSCRDGRTQRSGVPSGSGQTHEGHGCGAEGHGRPSGKAAPGIEGQRPINGRSLRLCAGRHCSGRVFAPANPATRTIADDISPPGRKSKSEGRSILPRFHAPANPKEAFRSMADFLLVRPRRQGSENSRDSKSRALTSELQTVSAICPLLF